MRYIINYKKKIIDKYNIIMSFLGNIFSGEWLLNIFTPSEDNEEERSIYLKITDNDIELKLRDNISRSELISVLKQIHNDYDYIKNNTLSLFNDLFEEITEEEADIVTNLFKPSNVLFIGSSEISVDHYKNDSDLWVTKFYKIYSNNDDKDELAEISKKIDNYSSMTVDDIVIN
jgi:hypothetical protein